MSEAASCRERETSPEDCNRVRFCSTTPCQGWPDGGGREVQHSTLRTNFAPTSCLTRAVLSQGSSSFAPPSLRRPDLNPSSSVCCFSDASGVLYPCVLLVAGAAVHSIPVPPRSVPACRGSGTAGVPVGERSSTRLSRSWSTRFNPCSCAGHGPPSA